MIRTFFAFWLDGSRGKGIIKHAESDYDCMMIVKDETLVEYKTGYEKIGNPAFETWGYDVG